MLLLLCKRWTRRKEVEDEEEEEGEEIEKEREEEEKEGGVEGREGGVGGDRGVGGKRVGREGEERRRRRSRLPLRCLPKSGNRFRVVFFFQKVGLVKTECVTPETRGTLGFPVSVHNMFKFTQ